YIVRFLLDTPRALRGGGVLCDPPPVILEQFIPGVEPDQAALGCAGDISADLNDVVLEVPDPLAGLKLRETLPQHLAHALAMRRIPEMQDGVVPNGECRADRLEGAGCHSQHFPEQAPGRA